MSWTLTFAVANVPQPHGAKMTRNKEHWWKREKLEGLERELKSEGKVGRRYEMKVRRTAGSIWEW